LRTQNRVLQIKVFQFTNTANNALIKICKKEKKIILKRRLLGLVTEAEKDMQYFVEACGFAICGLIMKICEFAICGMAHRRNL
jgi:hypothetical protein